MLLLLFFVFLLQFFTYWIFEPIVSIVENVFEIRLSLIIALLVLILLISEKNIDYS